MNQTESSGESNVPIPGTLIWYYMICPRQVWLMAHQLNPDEDNPDLEYGRFLQREAYRREKKEVSLDRSKMDFLDRVHGEMIVVEVKKSSRAIESNRLQLAHYLLTLEENGIYVKGELRFPDERKRETVILDDQLRQHVLSVRAAVRRIMVDENPPAPQKTKWCRSCAYAFFCWA